MGKARDCRPAPVMAREDLTRWGYSTAYGQNVQIEFLWADDQYERLPGMAAELVRKPVAVIVASGGECFGTSGEGCDRNNSNRVPDRHRSGERRSGRQPQPAWRQLDRDRRVDDRGVRAIAP